MTGTDIVRRESMALDRLSDEKLEYIAGTSFVPTHYRNKVPEIMACVLTGREIGLGDMESLRSIYIVDGKPTFSAELMVRLIRKRGHSITGAFNQTKTAARAKGKRADNGDEGEFTFTLEMAQRAGLGGKQNWQRYPEAMMWARAVTQLARMLFPDCLGGVTYTREEVEAYESPRREQAVAGRPAVPDDVEVVDEFEQTPGVISDGQRTRLWTMAGDKVPEEALRDIVEEVTGQRSTKAIPPDAYDMVCAAVESYQPPELSGEELYEAEQSTFAIPESAKGAA